jgi:hypothetical protein
VPQRGWVYVIKNAAMPGLVKVGFSLQDPAIRAQDLAGTGTPFDFEVQFDALVYGPREVEQRAHAYLSDHLAGKEWFRCSVNAAVEAIRVSTDVILCEWQNEAEGVESKIDETPLQCCHPGCGNLVDRRKFGWLDVCDAHGN